LRIAFLDTPRKFGKSETNFGKKTPRMESLKRTN